MAVLSMQQVVVGILLPLAVALVVHSRWHDKPPPPPPPPQAQQVRHAAGRPGWWRSVRAAAAAGQRAWCGANAMLTSLLTLDQEEVAASGPQLLLCLWLLLGNSWLLCKAAALRSLGA